MQHLTLEALARLVDEPPLADEAIHLGTCLACRRELAEMRGQTAALGSLADPEPPAGAWTALEAALRGEGLIADIPRRAEIPFWRRPQVLRAAAALALFVLGGAAGMALRGRTAQVAAGPETVRGLPVTVHPTAAGGDGALASLPSTPAPEAPFAAEPDAGAGNGARLASNAAAPPAARRPVSPEVRRAARELAQAEAAYLTALQRYAAIADPQSGADADTRMAALERMLSTTRQALERAPDDPVINGYHMAALRERDALRREMAAGDKDWF
ncbi:hypothetical protein [Longimicrobium sp.]|uniref:hypothetical protein n=1 Tax=Longimicrobium sp. TaxID=2029185 RepID=UPI002B525368|nr:hypothetical protein [Longimicrobium sp.]HSU13111.1 hypothetical protein [Longimicrobium sp.]